MGLLATADYASARAVGVAVAILIVPVILIAGYYWLARSYREPRPNEPPRGDPPENPFGEQRQPVPAFQPQS